MVHRTDKDLIQLMVLTLSCNFIFPIRSKKLTNPRKKSSIRTILFEHLIISHANLPSSIFFLLSSVRFIINDIFKYRKFNNSYAFDAIIGAAFLLLFLEILVIAD